MKSKWVLGDRNPMSQLDDAAAQGVTNHGHALEGPAGHNLILLHRPD